MSSESKFVSASKCRKYENFQDSAAGSPVFACCAASRNRRTKLFRGLWIALVCGSVGFFGTPAKADPPNAYRMPAGSAIWALPPQTPHRVIQSPPLLSPQEKKERALRGTLTPAVATIDRAAVENVWRQPYAYGYFGAQPHRQWQRHFGWNQAYTQWTLK